MTQHRRLNVRAVRRRSESAVPHAHACLPRMRTRTPATFGLWKEKRGCDSSLTGYLGQPVFCPVTLATRRRGRAPYSWKSPRLCKCTIKRSVLCWGVAVAASHGCCHLARWLRCEVSICIVFDWKLYTANSWCLRVSLSSHILRVLTCFSH